MSNFETIQKTPTSEDCLTVVNDLIILCNIPVSLVNLVDDINSNLIVLLFERITGLSVSGFYSDVCGEQEADIIQAVISALSRNVLHLSLSHITGRAIAAGDRVALYNLLSVLKELQSLTDKNEKALMKRKVSRLKGRDVKKKTSLSKQLHIPPPLNIEKQLEDSFELKVQSLVKKSNNTLKAKSSVMKKYHLQYSMNSFKKPTYPPPCNKSYLLPWKLRRKSNSLKANSEPRNNLRPIEEKNQMSGFHHQNSSNNLIVELLEEFPFIERSPSLMKRIESTYARQLGRMHSRIKTCLMEKSKAQIEAEKISRRQSKLVGLLKKDIQQQEYLKKINDEKENRNKIRYCLRDFRLKSAKMKQYSDEFVKDMKKKMLKENIAEEKILERVFKEVMDMQSEHVDYLCQQVKEAGVQDAEQYLNYLTSLENLYQTQYAALSEKIANETNDAQVRLNAEKQAYGKMEREFKEVLKKEIRFMQRVIVDQIDDVHFRELDAQQYVEKKRRQI